MKTYTMPDGFEITIVDDRERRYKEQISEKETFDKLLDFAEKKAKEIEKRNKEKFFINL